MVNPKNLTLICFCIAAAATVAFVSLGDRPLENHEAFVSVTAREMIDTHEYVIPRFNDRPRLNKTPLPYWLAAAACGLTGRMDEFAVRLPAAVLAVLSVVSLLYFVTVLVDLRTAFFASMIWILSLGFIRYSHSGRPEMHLTFFMITCFLSFYAALEADGKFRQIVYALIFWISLGLSILAKAPSSIIFMAASAVIYLTAFKQWPKFKRIRPLWGFILFLAIVLPWPLAAAHAMHWDLSVWKQESISRFTGQAASGKSAHRWFYYFAPMFQYAVPWVAFLPLAIIAPFVKKWDRKRRLIAYLAICFFTAFVFLTLCSGKRQHYILPVMPVAAVLMGMVMEDMLFSRIVHREKDGINFLKWHLIVFSAFAILLLTVTVPTVYQGLSSFLAGRGIELPFYSTLPILPPVLMAAALIAGVSLGALLYRLKKTTAACLAVFGAATVVVVLSFAFAPAFPDQTENDVANLGRQFRTIIPAADPVFCYGYLDASLIHYFGRPIPPVSNADLQKVYAENGWLVVSGENVSKMPQYDFGEFRFFTIKKDDGPEPIAVYHKEKHLVSQ